MRHTLITSTVLLSAVVGLSSCAAVKRALSEEATYELAGEVRDEIEERTGAGTRRTDDYVVLFDSLHAVLDQDQDEESSWRPRFEGLDDADADGVDDDGRVAIVVRSAQSCLLVDGRHVDVVDGRC